VSLAILSAGLGAKAVAQDRGTLPERVTFPSADGRTTLIGYVYAPSGARGRAPAVVMMHGRAGAYSSRAQGRYDATTISQRHRMWGELWASLGYVAFLVDGFGPRGYASGFPPHSYKQRPAAVNEVFVRPFDAYGALAYLRGREDVAADRIGLQGWSNGGSAALATMSVDAPGIRDHTAAMGFRAALVFYPACGLRGHFRESGYQPYAAVRVFHGTADDEVSYARCRALVRRSEKRGGDITIRIYPDATHAFDDPGRRRQSNPANAAAKEDAMARAERFFAEKLGEAAR
jgi:carboxymethylenebutenolidase